MTQPDRRASYGGRSHRDESLEALGFRAGNAFLPNTWLNLWGWAALVFFAGVLFTVFAVITRSFLFSILSAPLVAWGMAWMADYISGLRNRRKDR